MAKKTKKKPTLPHRMCGTQYYHLTLCDKFPELRKRRVEIQARIDTILSSPQASRRLAVRENAIVTIPIVVHVVYRTQAENISDGQISSQLDVLNRDYRRLNPDWTNTPDVWRGLASDAGIHFELAKRDPSGQATDGITRTKTTKTEFNIDNAVKARRTGGADPWPSDKYLNLWVCSLGGGLLGYAQFPGMPPETDGVVILNTAFGTTGSVQEPFHLGRTATHEIGHWLNLNHIWGDTNDCSGTDHVADTPPAVTANTGKPTFPRVTCHNAPNGDMFMNYMDYVDDDSMYMFTSGQVARMRATLDGPRNSFNP
jgi:Pregnancy-associated plasma protein-A